MVMVVLGEGHACYYGDGSTQGAAHMAMVVLGEGQHITMVMVVFGQSL